MQNQKYIDALGLTEEELLAGFERSRMCVYLLSYLFAEKLMAQLVECSADDNDEEALMQKMMDYGVGIGLVFRGFTPSLISGFGSDEGWSGAPIAGWLRKELADVLEQIPEDEYDKWSSDQYIVDFAGQTMVGELVQLAMDSESESEASKRLTSFALRWSRIWSGDATDLGDAGACGEAEQQ